MITPFIVKLSILETTNLANICFECVLFVGVSRGRGKNGYNREINGYNSICFQQYKKSVSTKHRLVS